MIETVEDEIILKLINTSNLVCSFPNLTFSSLHITESKLNNRIV